MAHAYYFFNKCVDRPQTRARASHFRHAHVRMAPWRADQKNWGTSYVYSCSFMRFTVEVGLWAKNCAVPNIFIVLVRT